MTAVAEDIRAALIASGSLVPSDDAASPARAVVVDEPSVEELDGTVEVAETGDVRELARQEIRSRAAAGLPELSGKVLGKMYGRSERWGRARIAEVGSSQGAASPVRAAARTEDDTARAAATGTHTPQATLTVDPAPADARHDAAEPEPQTARQVAPAAPGEAPRDADEVPARAAARPPGKPRAWPVLLLALPAFVAIWGGWVGLGEMAGFGPVNLLPGIGKGWTLNTAITLPIGVEAYAAYALRVWLSGVAPTERAREFAMFSAVGALVLGMAGQVAYHLMSADGMTVAPWQITTFVSCLPVVVLGCGAALVHLLHNHGRD